MKSAAHPAMSASVIHRKAAPRRPAPVAARGTPPLPHSAGESSSVRCACGGGCPRCENSSLLSQPGDRWEVEADRTADQVMRSPAAATPLLSHAAVTATPSPDIAHLPTSVAQTLRGSGEPLDAATRAQMEPRFGQDFSGVRIFRGAQAESSAEAVNANAYTVGPNVVFGPGQYAPGTSAGQRLLAHELAHVAQQGATQGGASGRPLIQRDDKDKKSPDSKPAPASKPTAAGGAGAGRVAAAIKLLQNAKKIVLADPTAKAEQHTYVAGVRTFLEKTVTDVALSTVFATLPYFQRSSAIERARNALYAIQHFEKGFNGSKPDWSDAGSWDDAIGALQMAQGDIAVLLGDPAPAKPQSAPVDDIVVWRYINGALNAHQGSVLGAWTELKASRDESPARAADPNLAAAEHYLYARFLAEDTPLPSFFVADMAMGYGLFKNFMNDTVGLPPPSFSDNPATPSSDAQIKFGTQGAFEGSWVTDDSLLTKGLENAQDSEVYYDF